MNRAQLLAQAGIVIRRTLRTPRHGPPYTRCPYCHAQVEASTTPRASMLQVRTQLKVRLAKHMEDCSGKGND